mmetsp:Transcript_12711/g.29212  ORF Transcript_12711/g.29212 Transcript_12711/m.29212 type:complete len:108 (-) Transcript_12711:529-852(-)
MLPKQTSPAEPTQSTSDTHDLAGEHSSTDRSNVTPQNEPRTVTVLTASGETGDVDGGSVGAVAVGPAVGSRVTGVGAPLRLGDADTLGAAVGPGLSEGCDVGLGAAQ